MNKFKNKKKKGFTLIELIIVLAIMVIIGAIAIPNFAAVRDNSKNKADVQSCETIKRTVLMLVADGTVKNASTYTLGIANPNTITDDDATPTSTQAERDAMKAALKDVKKPQGKVQTYNKADKKYNPPADAAADASSYSIEITSGGDVYVETK